MTVGVSVGAGVYGAGVAVLVPDGVPVGVRNTGLLEVGVGVGRVITCPHDERIASISAPKIRRNHRRRFILSVPQGNGR